VALTLSTYLRSLRPSLFACALSDVVPPDFGFELESNELELESVAEYFVELLLLEVVELGLLLLLKFEDLSVGALYFVLEPVDGGLLLDKGLLLVLGLVDDLLLPELYLLLLLLPPEGLLELEEDLEPPLEGLLELELLLELLELLEPELELFEPPFWASIFVAKSATEIIAKQ